jgi:hypothetical protein
VSCGNIDVNWFRRGAGASGAVFEVEHSTCVYSGLLRFNDVAIDFPIPQAFIVGDGERTRAKFEREVARRTFDSGCKASPNSSTTIKCARLGSTTRQSGRESKSGPIIHPPSGSEWLKASSGRSARYGSSFGGGWQPAARRFMCGLQNQVVRLPDLGEGHQPLSGSGIRPLDGLRRLGLWHV